MANPQDELDALRAQVASLTARVHKLEQKAGIEPAAYAPPPRPPAPSVAVPSVPAAVAGIPPQAPVAEVSPPKRDGGNLEGQIGKLWFNRIGIIAILIGAGLFLKYAFDNGWIGPAGQVALGLIAGIGVVLWSERFRSKGYIPFSYSLKAIGIGVMYLSLWAASQYYHLVAPAVAFGAMILVTAATIVLSLSQDAEILAAFALIGGFSTPVLVSTGRNEEVILFSYVLLLDVAILIISVLRPWRRLLWGSFVGTMILYIGWYNEYYSLGQRPTTVLFTVLFAAVFAAIPLFTSHVKSSISAGPSVTLTFLPLLNAAALFLALFAMYELEKDLLAWYSLVLAAAYLGLSSMFKRRVVVRGDSTKLINLIHVAIAIAFITVAIPLKLDAHWITIGWLIESGVLLYVGARTGAGFLRVFAGVTLALGVFRLLVFDNFYPQTLIFNTRFATYLVAVVVLGGVVWAGARSESENERIWTRIAGVALNLLALRALTLEVSDYFLRGAGSAYLNAAAYRQSHLGRDFSFSALWLAYGAMLMVIGFRRQTPFVRWQALVLIAFTIGKVFIYDVSVLEQGYRILSFIALGVVLMGISYAYHRDWLKLSARPADQSSKGTPA